MSRRTANPWLTGLAAALIALVSMVSASLMAPDRGDAAETVAQLTFGLSADDLCGTVGDHDHRCPFCRLLTDPPSTEPIERSTRLIPHDGWLSPADLSGAAQARFSPQSARAPPAQA